MSREAEDDPSAGAEVVDVSKSFGNEGVLRRMTFRVEKGKTCVLLGPSGVGKTTTLNVIAGILRPDSGSISIGGVTVEQRGNQWTEVHVKSSERGVGYVFQDYLLFPHLSVFDNVAYGLRARHVQQTKIREKVREALAMLDIQDLGEKKPSQISGGQMQRTALARILVLEPKVILLDEPLSALDQTTRESLRVSLKKLFDELGSTVIYVTHDIDEAFFFGQKIGIMESGTLSFFGEKGELLERLTSSLAGFIGFNTLKARRIDERSDLFVLVDSGIQVSIPLKNPQERNMAGLEVIIAIPPESVQIDRKTSGSQHGIPMRVANLWELRGRVRVELESSNQKLIAEISRNEFEGLSPRVGSEVDVRLAEGFVVNQSK